MAIAYSSELFYACRDGDISNIKSLLSRTSTEDLNRLDPNGSSCLHVACASGRVEVVRLLLEYGAFRELKDANDRTAAYVAKTASIKKLFTRMEEDIAEHYGKIPSKQREWLFDKDTAIKFSRAIDFGRIKNRDIKRTVKKIERANIMPNDQSRTSKLYKHYLKSAIEQNDPNFLLKIYTIEGSFYRQLNEYITRGGKREVYKKLCGKWSGYYAGIIMKHPKLAVYYFTGQTFRGMEITLEELDRYKVGITLTNKAFQSTSKSRKVSMPFAHRQTPFMGTLPVILIYKISVPNSALDITSLSEFPDEQEVLIVPGSCFEVVNVIKNDTEYEIHLEQLKLKHDLYYY